MNKIYSEIEIKSEFDVNKGIHLNLVKKSKNEKELIYNLKKTKLFSKIITLKQNKKIKIICQSSKERNYLKPYPNKKNFFGIKFKRLIPDISKNYDSLEIISKIDFPFFKFNNNLIASLTDKYHDKKMLKIKYNSILLPFCSKTSFSLFKGYKRNFNYFGAKINFDNFFKIYDTFFDLQIKKVYFKNFEKIDNDFALKLKHKKNSINRELIPEGSKYLFEIHHSFFAKQNYVFFLRNNYKTFFYSFFLPRFSNLEFEYDLLFTNSERYRSFNLRGFKNIYKDHCDDFFFSCFFGGKLNFYNFDKLERKKINPFIFFSSLRRKNEGFNYEAGFGIEKTFDSSQLEFLYNIKANDFQIRFIKD